MDLPDVILGRGGAITYQFALGETVHGLLSLGAQRFNGCGTEADPNE